MVDAVVYKTLIKEIGSVFSRQELRIRSAKNTRLGVFTTFIKIFNHLFGRLGDSLKHCVKSEPKRETGRLTIYKHVFVAMCDMIWTTQIWSERNRNNCVWKKWIPSSDSPRTHSFQPTLLEDHLIAKRNTVTTKMTKK